MSKSREVPKWITNIKNDRVRKAWVGWWKRPWTIPTANTAAVGFKKALWEHGYLTPNFTREEAKSKDGRGIPSQLRKNAQRAAIAWEKVRHDCGDKVVSILSWYRSPQHNQAVGGASQSRHMKADAGDIDGAVRARLGGRTFDRACERHFTGIGYNPGGVVRHADRGPRRTWNY